MHRTEKPFRISRLLAATFLLWIMPHAGQGAPPAAPTIPCPPLHDPDPIKWGWLVDEDNNQRCGLLAPVRPPNRCKHWLDCSEDQLVRAEELRSTEKSFYPSQMDRIKWKDPSYHLVTGNKSPATSCNGQLFFPVIDTANLASTEASRSALSSSVTPRVHSGPERSLAGTVSWQNDRENNPDDVNPSPILRCFDQSNTRLQLKHSDRSGFSIYRGQSGHFYLMSDESKK